MLLYGSGLQAKLVGQARLDSLVSRLAACRVEDTNKVKLLNDLSFYYQYDHPETGLQYGQQSVVLAQRLHWDKGIAAATADIGHNYFRKSDFKTALQYYLDALKQYQKMDNKTGVARVSNALGNAYRNMGNYPKAHTFYFQSLNIYQQLKDTIGIRNATHNIGSYYVDQCDYPMALMYHLKALKMYEQAGEKEGLGRISDNIGTDYLLQKDYPKALEYFNKAIINDDVIGDKESIGNHLFNIGRTYYEQQNNTVALRFFTEALNKYNETGSKKGIANVHAETGKVLVRQKDYATATACFFKALKIDEAIGDKKNEAKNLGYIGDAYLAIIRDPSLGHSRLNDFNTELRLADSLLPGSKDLLLRRAIDFLQQGVSIAQAINVADVLQSCYANLADAYKYSGEYELAMQYSNHYHALKDSLFSIQNNDKMAKMMAEKDYEKQHYADSVNAGMQLSMANMKYQQQRSYTIMGIAGMLLLVLFSVFLIRNYRIQKKLNATITQLVNEQEQIIAQRTAELAESNARLAHANKRLIELIQYNAHNMREPLARLMGAMIIQEYLPGEEFYSEIWPQMQKAITDLDNSIKEVITLADETVVNYEL